MKFDDKLLTVTEGGGSAAYPTDGLVGRYTFDDDLTDSYNSNDFTVDEGTVSYGSGGPGDFGYLNVTAGASWIINTNSDIINVFKGSNTFSMSMWLRNSSADAGWWVGACSNNGSASGTVQFYYHGGTLGMQFAHNESVETNDAYLTTTWKHYVFTYDGTTLKIYEDAIEIDSGAAGAATTSMTGLTFPGRYNATSATNQVYALMYVYDKALSTDDITTLYNDGDGV